MTAMATGERRPPTGRPARRRRPAAAPAGGPGPPGPPPAGEIDEAEVTRFVETVAARAAAELERPARPAD